jgi:hypothetical protein
LKLQSHMRVGTLYACYPERSIGNRCIFVAYLLRPCENFCVMTSCDFGRTWLIRMRHDFLDCLVKRKSRAAVVGVTCLMLVAAAMASSLGFSHKEPLFLAASCVSGASKEAKAGIRLLRIAIFFKSKSRHAHDLRFIKYTGDRQPRGERFECAASAGFRQQHQKILVHVHDTIHFERYRRHAAIFPASLPTSKLETPFSKAAYDPRTCS